MMSTREMTMKTNLAFTSRSFLLRLAVAAMIVLLFALLSRAGGPKCVAGTSWFDPTMTGQALTWSPGVVTYYTDQGDLSPILPNASANALVADAFSQWTSVPTSALTAASGGQLAEEVNGTNVTVNSDGTISVPADIQSTATGTPIGIVYDYDGSVTNALLGSGAGDPSQCFSNAAFGGNDNYGSLATYQHGLIVINGQCSQKSSQLADVEYRLVRVIGTVLGLGWSQVNANVITGNPAATADDYAGFPVMHYIDPPLCAPITNCYSAPYQPKMDDAAAISRLYPVTAQNQSNFPGKQVFASVTGRIHGSVWFTDRSGNRTQPMQGVNVVARWIDPTTHLPSRRYAASSVSGFLFSGNAGNPITGFNDSLGDPYGEWGSTTSSVEGFFDLAGLQLPNGGTAQYQLSVEPLDPIWSVGVGPYAPWLVAPSGSAQPIVVTVAAGQDVQQDILMSGSAQPMQQWASESWTSPAQIPAAGQWMGTLGSYGNVAYFTLPAQSNRTLSVAVMALDELGNASVAKFQPVIGLWAASDAQGSTPPAFTPSPFNTMMFGLTRLDAQVTSSTNFRIAISDLRGDGRPDYRYQARLLYADSISPPRVGVSGGVVAVQGTGFAPGLTATIGSTPATSLAVNSGQMMLAVPAQGDGTQNITVTDPVTGASSTMTNAFTYGAAASDNIVLIGRGLNPPTAVGTTAPSAMIVRVLASDGVTPVGGATIGWSAGNSLQLSACGGASSCTVTSDQSGTAVAWLTPAAVGTSTITATLAPGSYTPAKSVGATLSATESASDIGILTPYLWIGQGATVNAPLTARLLSNGAPRSGGTVNFTVVSGAGTLSAASAQTNTTGYATVTLSMKQLAAGVQVSACIAPGNAPCQMFYVNPVPLSQLNLQSVAGAGQVSTGAAFQPVIVRVTDSSSPPNPVLAAVVAFQTTVLRPGGSPPGGGGGETNPGNPAMPVILSVSQSSATTDVNGLASIVPSSGGFGAPVEVNVLVTAGTNALLDYPLEVMLASGGGSVASPLSPRATMPRATTSTRAIEVAPIRATGAPPRYLRDAALCY